VTAKNNKNKHMKKFVFLSIIIVSLAMHPYAFAQNSAYSFEVKISGNGNSSIIFIPGFACSGDVWNETRSAFEKNFTCYTITMAGFAGVAAQANPSFSSWEKAIADYIKENKINKPVVIGHSMGGGLAMALAADYPDLIASIIVVDALPCLAALRDSSFKANENADYSAIVSQITSMQDKQFYLMQKMSMPGLLADTAKLEQVVQWSVKSDRKTFAEMYCSFSNTDLRTKISAIKCPSLILLEPYFVNFKSAVNEQFKNLKTANFQYAVKGLHFIMYDDKEWFRQQLADFIVK
jgi:pimeloyl-ACP methyl ester carboxylesterase